MRHKTSIYHHSFAFMGAAVILLAALLVYYNFIDGVLIRKPVTYQSDPLNIVTDKDVYYRGETVYGHIEYCKHRNIEAHLQWTLIDHFLTIFPPKSSTVEKGCGVVELRIDTLPKTMIPADEVHFEGLLQYQVNPFSVIKIPLKTQSFKVI